MHISRHPHDAGELQKHITATYLSLRIGIALVALSFPLLLWLGGSLFLDLPLQGSMSAYYHTGMRNVFVGLLYAIGAFLYLYKGFSKLENVVLNAAGILAIGVAMFPTEDPAAVVPGQRGELLTLHGLCAVSFFACIAFVCIFLANDTLGLMKDRRRAAVYRRVYRTLGTLMLLAPATAWLLSYLLQRSAAVFAVELAGVWVFAAYWLVKSSEISETGAECRAVEGRVAIAEGGELVRSEDAHGPEAHGAASVPAPA